MNKVTRLTGAKIKGSGAVRPTVVARPKPRKPQLNGKTASFIWAFWGDSDLTTMGQETMRLKKAMDGYDHKVLMKHNHTPSWIDLSEGDERNADVMRPPTPENFTSELVRLAKAGYIIDIYINSHGNNGEFHASGGSHHATPRRITSAMIKALPEAAELDCLPIRLVYQTQCYAASLNQDWRSIGAKIAVGARYIQFYPNQFGNFVSDWNKGKTVGQSNSGADTAWVRTQAQTYILGDAVAQRRAGRFDGCKFGNTVLGKKDCAKDYFVPRWLRSNEWRNNMSGKENMNYSSNMMAAGRRKTKKADKNLTW